MFKNHIYFLGYVGTCLREGGYRGTHLIMHILNNFPCTSGINWTRSKIALASLVQIYELVQFIPEVHGKSFNMSIELHPPQPYIWSKLEHYCHNSFRETGENHSQQDNILWIQASSVFSSSLSFGFPQQQIFNLHFK